MDLETLSKILETYSILTRYHTRELNLYTVGIGDLNPCTVWLPGEVLTPGLTV
jgi:hypothetical protein